jgi:hypothetical protein
VAYEASDATLKCKILIKDAIEEDLDKLEEEAKAINRKEYQKFKWELGEGFGTFDGPKNSLENWGDLPILREMLERLKRENEEAEKVGGGVEEGEAMETGNGAEAGAEEELVG